MRIPPFFFLWDKYCPVWTEYIPISIVIFSNLPYNELIIIRVSETGMCIRKEERVWRNCFISSNVWRRI